MGWRSTYAFGDQPRRTGERLFRVRCHVSTVAFAVLSLDGSTLVILLCRRADVGGFEGVLFARLPNW